MPYRFVRYDSAWFSQRFTAWYTGSVGFIRDSYASLVLQVLHGIYMIVYGSIFIWP